MGIIRQTQASKLLLNEFKNDFTAISAVELIKRLKSNINKTTVYRLLDKLADDGLLHYFLDMNGVKWFAKCKCCSKTNHFDIYPHFQCTDCGIVECLDVKVNIPEMLDRKITNSHVLVLGKCSICIG